MKKAGGYCAWLQRFIDGWEEPPFGSQGVWSYDVVMFGLTVSRGSVMPMPSAETEYLLSGPWLFDPITTPLSRTKRVMRSDHSRPSKYRIARVSALLSVKTTPKFPLSRHLDLGSNRISKEGVVKGDTHNCPP